jgi:methylation protein EvaC
MSQCLICASNCELVIDFGPMPVASRFLLPAETANEKFFPLAAVFCPACAMVQLRDPVDPAELFNEGYTFFSSTSARMAGHFRLLAEHAMSLSRHARDPLIVELGSNDGVLLRHVAASGVRHLGVEPSANVADVARDRGVTTITRFFDESLAAEIAGAQGPASVILAANAMCHIPDLRGVARGIEILLADDGLLIFEDPYLGDILAITAFDQIYDEHVFYFSLTSVRRLFRAHGLEVVNVEPLGVHGGSMRYTLAREGRRAPAPAVGELQSREDWQRLGSVEAYGDFRRRTEEKRDALMAMLHGLRRAGKRISGYAATAKSATAINYCGISTDLVDCVYDTTPVKHGRVTPGAHIPVRPHADFATAPPDYALLFAWNHEEEIVAKEQPFLAGGGRFISYMPTVRTIPGDR